MCSATNGYRTVKTLGLAAAAVPAAFPLDRPAAGTAKQEPREERDTKDGDGRVYRREVGASNPVVEAPAGTKPDQQDSSPLPEDETGKGECNRRQQEEQQELEHSHRC